YARFDQQYYLVDDILVKSDRMSMAHAVEMRPPFLDHRIVEFAATLPASLKVRGSRQKFLLKDLMKDKLPQSILQRGKIGFDIPAHEWLRGPLRPLLEDTLRAGVAEYRGLFRSEVIEKYRREHMERRINAGYHLWGLLIMFLWMKNGKSSRPLWPCRRMDEGLLGLSRCVDHDLLIGIQRLAPDLRNEVQPVAGDKLANLLKVIPFDRNVVSIGLHP